MNMVCWLHDLQHRLAIMPTVTHNSASMAGRLGDVPSIERSTALLPQSPLCLFEERQGPLALPCTSDKDVCCFLLPIRHFLFVAQGVPKSGHGPQCSRQALAQQSQCHRHLVGAAVDAGVCEPPCEWCMRWRDVVTKVRHASTTKLQYSSCIRLDGPGVVFLLLPNTHTL